MSVYLDARILVALFTDDAFSSRADKILRQLKTSMVVSDFAAAEFVSALAKERACARLPSSGRLRLPGSRIGTFPGAAYITSPGHIWRPT